MGTWKYCTGKDCCKPGEQREFWKDAGYEQYKAVNGEHFSDNLSAWAAKQMKSKNEVVPWTVDEVKSAYTNLGYKKPECNTWGDVAYIANRARMMYFADKIISEADCFKIVDAELKHPNAYPGCAFNRYMADVMGRNIEIPWNIVK